MATKIYLIDDHEVVRRGLFRLFRNVPNILVVGESSTVEDSHEGVAVADPDVIIMDINLPDGSGIDLCRQLASDRPFTKTLLYTSYSGAEKLCDAYLSGAFGLASKATSGVDLIESVRCVASGKSLLSRRLVAHELRQVHAKQKMGQEIESLTDRELLVFELLGRGLSNREIGLQMRVTERTTKNHVTKILAKLDFDGRMQLAIFAAKLRIAGREPMHADPISKYLH